MAVTVHVYQVFSASAWLTTHVVFPNAPWGVMFVEVTSVFVASKTSNRRVRSPHGRKSSTSDALSVTSTGVSELT
jgi:hypothetical protein